MAVNVNTALPKHRYCANVALKAITFAKSEKDWTPNNIKRLIVSPDYVMATLFVGYNNRIVTQQALDPNQYRECVCDPKYVPMISVLGANGYKVCSHVEEIVFCMRSLNSPDLQLSNAETNLQLIKGEGVANRFVRLYSVVFFDGTIREYYERYKNNFRSPTFHTPETDNQCKVVYMAHKNDWYKGHYLRPDDYAADAPDGALAVMLSKIEAHVSEAVKKATVQKAKSKGLGNLEEKVRSEFDYLKAVISGSMRIYSMLKHTENYSLIAQMLCQLDTESSFTDRLNDLCAVNMNFCDIFDMVDEKMKAVMQRSGVVFTSPDATKGDAELAQEELVRIKQITYKAYMNLFNFYDTLMAEVRSLLPDTFASHVRNSDMRINSQGDAASGISYRRAGLYLSITNISAQINELLLNNEDKKLAPHDYSINDKISKLASEWQEQIANSDNNIQFDKHKMLDLCIAMAIENKAKGSNQQQLTISGIKNSKALQPFFPDEIQSLSLEGGELPAIQQLRVLCDALLLLLLSDKDKLALANQNIGFDRLSLAIDSNKVFINRYSVEDVIKKTEADKDLNTLQSNIDLVNILLSGDKPADEEAEPDEDFFSDLDEVRSETLSSIEYYIKELIHIADKCCEERGRAVPCIPEFTLPLSCYTEFENFPYNIDPKPTIKEKYTIEDFVDFLKAYNYCMLGANMADLVTSHYAAIDYGSKSLGRKLPLVFNSLGMHLANNGNGRGKSHLVTWWMELLFEKRRHRGNAKLQDLYYASKAFAVWLLAKSDKALTRNMVNFRLMEQMLNDWR